MRLLGAAFVSNVSTRVRLRSVWEMHVEEIPTGVVERNNYESKLRSPAATHLASAGWTPNLLAQVGSDAPLAHTLEFTLVGDAWAPSVGVPGAPTTALLGSLRSAQNEPQGWNNVVLPALTADNVERRSDTLVVITLPISTNYSILKPETLRITLPAVTLRSEAEINISSTLSMPEWARWAPVDVHPIILHPDVGRVTMATALSLETDLQTLGLSTTIALSIEGDTWAPEVGLFGHPINAELASAALDRRSVPCGKRRGGRRAGR